MEIFYTPQDVEETYGIKKTMLANWRANLIGPDCLKSWPLTKTEPVLLIVTEPVIARCSVASAE
ncbi:conserved domain protein [delta proteobacterium NaphS2]|nr:conserved domain protein [delta proteobacterium NaphS2]